MKAARLFAYNAAPRLVEVPEPKITGPLDVIVRIAGAGVCRTDLHLVEGVFDQVRDKLPFTLGHENAGWIEEVGPGVPDLAKQFPLEDVADVLHLLETGRIEGRAVLVPAAARSARAPAEAASLAVAAR